MPVFRPVRRRDALQSASSQAASQVPAGPPLSRRLVVYGTPAPRPIGRVYQARPNAAAYVAVTPPVTRPAFRPVTRRTPFAPGNQWAASLPPTSPTILPPRGMSVRGGARNIPSLGRVILNRRSGLVASLALSTPPNPPRPPRPAQRLPLAPQAGRVFVGRASTKLPANPGPAQYFARGMFPACYFAPTYFPGGTSLVGGYWIPRGKTVRPPIPRPRTGQILLGRSPLPASLAQFCKPPRGLFVRAPIAIPLHGRVQFGNTSGVAGSVTFNFDLLEAVASALNTQANLSGAVPGGFWADQAPDGAAFPYGVVLEIAEAAHFSSADASGVHPFIDDGQVQISIFVEGGKALARTIGQQVEDALNDATLTFSKGYLMNLRRMHRTSVLDPAKGPNGGDVWCRVLTLDTVVGRSL